jgi:hypothetical protein
MELARLVQEIKRYNKLLTESKGSGPQLGRVNDENVIAKVCDLEFGGCAGGWPGDKFQSRWSSSGPDSQ